MPYSSPYLFIDSIPVPFELEYNIISIYSWMCTYIIILVRTLTFQIVVMPYIRIGWATHTIQSYYGVQV